MDGDKFQAIAEKAIRPAYRNLNESDTIDLAAVKAVAVDFYCCILAVENHSGSSRETSLAKTKIEEAVMWAVKHITK